ncbi:hypothetical protein BZG36_04246 [Bifiguratus adelaidae]|uniref:Uncharacterized protein n=1 Tax=Bifiguratus adelaidae TaxID=1938954 RepID=A0A261Y0Y3_9FUNG|nr:hypothetical protein BZG36_04246 [Bifiguratus adelaidae]
MRRITTIRLQPSDDADVVSTPYSAEHRQKPEEVGETLKPDEVAEVSIQESSGTCSHLLLGDKTQDEGSISAVSDADISALKDGHVTSNAVTASRQEQITVPIVSQADKEETVNTNHDTASSAEKGFGRMFGIYEPIEVANDKHSSPIRRQGILLFTDRDGEIRTADAVLTSDIPTAEEDETYLNITHAALAPKVDVNVEQAADDINVAIRPPSPSAQGLNPSVTFSLTKQSLSTPGNVDVTYHKTSTLAYMKQQTHSFHWGFANILRDAHGVQIAETRRLPYQRPVIISWGVGEAKQDKSEFIHTSFSNYLFRYEFTFQGNTFRWTRDSPFTHDMSLYLVVTMSSPYSSQKSHLKTVATFHSSGLGYLKHIGTLRIYESIYSILALQREDNPQTSDMEGLDPRKTFEAVAIVTCTTLIDLLREVVQKAIKMGAGAGGVVG